MKIGLNRSFYVVIAIILLFLPLSWVSADGGTQNQGEPIFTGNAESIEAIQDALISSIENSSQSISWGSHSISMIIIAPNNSNFINAAEAYAEFKTNYGIPTVVVSNHSLYPGYDAQEKIRNAIAWYYETYAIEWVLILGDTNVIPIRYVRNGDTAIISGTDEDFNLPGGNALKPTDFYYAELTGNWNIDEDQYWGENPDQNEASDEYEMDFIPEVYLGRLPVEDIQELHLVLNKTMAYEQGTNIGSEANNFLGISAISDYPYSGDEDGEDEAYLTQYIIDEYVNGTMNWNHALEYNPAFYTPKSDDRIVPLSSVNVADEANAGTSIIFFAGHGSKSRLVTKSPGDPISTSSLSQWNNIDFPSFIYASACSTNSYDSEGSLGEEMLLHETGGAIGYVGSMRVSWYYPNDTALEQDNRGMAKLYFEQMLQNNYYQQGKALYEAKKAYVNSDWFQLALERQTDPDDDFNFFEMERKTIMSYMLLGDPSVDIYSDIPIDADLAIPSGQDLYQNSFLRIPVTNSEGNEVPFARVILYTETGQQEHFVADEKGIVTILTPNATSMTYTICGHNLKLSSPKNVTLLTDNTFPTFSSDFDASGSRISIQQTWQGTITLTDTEAGPYGVFFVLHNKDTQDFQIYEMFTASEGFWDDSAEFIINLTSLEMGTYQYFVCGADGAGHIIFGLTDQKIPTLFVSVPLIINVFWIVGAISLVAITVYFLRQIIPSKQVMKVVIID